MAERLDSTLNLPPIGLRPGEDINKLVWLLPAGLLVVAVLPWPYTFYMGLRWLVSIAAAFLAYKEFILNGRKLNIYAILFGAMALLMNAIIPVELPKLVWVVIDLCCAAFFVAHLKFCSPRS